MWTAIFTRKEDGLHIEASLGDRITSRKMAKIAARQRAANLRQRYGELTISIVKDGSKQAEEVDDNEDLFDYKWKDTPVVKQLPSPRKDAAEMKEYSYAYPKMEKLEAGQ